MAGKIKFNDRLNASSLMEVIVAMVILLIIFGIAMTIYTHVAGSEISAGRIQAQTILEATASNRQLTSQLGTTSVDTAGLHLVIVVKNWEGGPGLRTLLLTAYRDSLRLAEKRILVLP